jgi:hypothetical protein
MPGARQRIGRATGHPNRSNRRPTRVAIHDHNVWLRVRVHRRLRVHRRFRISAVSRFLRVGVLARVRIAASFARQNVYARIPVVGRSIQTRIGVGSINVVTVDAKHRRASNARDDR